MVASIIAYGAALLGGGATAVAISTFAVNFAVSYIVGRIFAPNDPTANQPVDQGVRQQVAPNTTNSIPIVYGSAFMGGTFVDAVLTTDQKTMYYVLAISSISPNGQFSYDRTKFYYGDRLVTFDGSDLTKVVSLTDGAGNVDTKINGFLYVNLYTSTDAGTITNVTGTSPSTFMGGSDIAAGQRWTGTRQMNGLAFAIVKLIYSQDAGTTNLQPITFNVTQNLNGTGAAKPGDVWADYVRNEVYGGGMAAALIDSASATALNTYADQTITFTDSSGNPATQARYRINGVLDTGQNVLANIDRIMLACDSWNAYNAASGKWSIVINKAESTSYAFDDTNIIGEIKVSLTDISNSINQIEAQFPSKLNRDQRDLVYLETPGGLLYANEPINKFSCNFDLINESVQVSYLANRVLEQAREDLIVTINAAYPAIQIDAGDVVSITNTSYGWSSKLFRVMKVSEISLPDGNLGANLELNEYNAAVYDDVAITQYSPAPNSNLSSASFFSALTAPVVSASRPADSVPSFDIQITCPSIGRTTRLTLFYSTFSSPTASQWTLLDTFVSSASTPLTPSTTFTFLNLILPAGTYYFGFVAANDISQSQISGTSSGLVWAPTGTVGTQTAIVYLYQWSNSTPGNPSGNSIWTWGTASNAGYTGGNGWTVALPVNPGTAGTYLWQASTSISAPASTATTTVSWASGFSVQAIAQNGATGASGVNSATVNLYNKNTTTSPPALFSGTFTYTFSTGVLSGGTLNGWSQLPPAIASGEYLFISLATASSTSATDTITAGEFSTPQTISGVGVNGANTAIVDLFNKNTSAVTPPTTFSGTFTYTFSTAILSGGTLNGWSQSAPSLSAGEYLWVRSATAFAIATTDTIASTEFSAAVISGVAGVNGATGNTGNSAVICYALYAGNPTVTGSAVTISGTGLPNTNSFSPTSATAFSYAVQNPGASQAMFQSDGIYYPVANQTIWNTPYLSNLKVGNLSAISADLGTITAGTITGALIQTSASGQRVLMNYSLNNLQVYDASNTLTVELGGTAGQLYVSSQSTVSPASGIFINSPVVPALYGNNTSSTNTFASAAGVYGLGSACNGVCGEAIGSGVGVYGFARYAGGTSQGVRGVNSASGGGTITSGIIGSSIAYDFYADGAGTNYGPFTGAHDVLVPITENIEIGYIVCDVQLIIAKNISNTVFEVAISVSANQVPLGIMVANNGLLANTQPAAFIEKVEWIEVDGKMQKITVMYPEYEIDKDLYNYCAANAVGEGQVYVCGESGNIAAGDLIVTSSVAGVGMKQSDNIVRNITVAKARQAMSFTDTTTPVLVACIYLCG